MTIKNLTERFKPVLPLISFVSSIICFIFQAEMSKEGSWLKSLFPWENKDLTDSVIKIISDIIGGFGIALLIYIIYPLFLRNFTFKNDRFAYYTITSRLPQIFSEFVVKENIKGENSGVKKETWSPSVAFDSNWDYIISGAFNMSPSSGNNIELDKAKYEEKYEQFVKNKFCENYQDNMLDAYRKLPFLLVEHYFYYDLLRRYREKNEDLIRDPYVRKKVNLGDKHLLKSILFKSEYESLLLKLGVFANTADLSQYGNQAVIKCDSKISPDDSLKAKKYILSIKNGKIDIITDNCGLELLSDIILANNLLSEGIAQTVVFHVRILPQYVSDVILSAYGDDFARLFESLESYSEEIDKERISSIKEQFYEYLRAKTGKRIIIKPSLFWNLPVPFLRTKKLFKERIGKSDLVILKGDLNYRKLIKDKDYKSKMRFKYVSWRLGYNILAQRAIKSSLVDIGRSFAAIRRREKIRDNLRGLNGDYGVIRFFRMWFPKRK